MGKGKNLILLFSIALLSITSCKKTTNSNCNLTPENNLVICEASDTISSVSGFTLNYYANGVDKKSEGNYDNGTPTGFWKFYFPNGKIEREGNFTNGIADGYWNVYYENGNILSEGSFKDCERTGFWKYYYESDNQAVQFEGNYDSNMKVNNWKMYNLAGDLKTQYDCN